MSIESPEIGETAVEKDDKKDFWEREELQQLVRGERAGVLTWKSEEAKEIADKNNLDIEELPPPVEGLETPGRYILAIKENTADILDEKIKDVLFDEISDETENLYNKIKEMPAIKALRFLAEQSFDKKGLEPPGVAALEGLLYGYKPCDIKYYIKTRYFGKEKHPYEDAGYKALGCVICEKCAEKLKKYPDLSSQKQKKH